MSALPREAEMKLLTAGNAYARYHVPDPRDPAHPLCGLGRPETVWTEAQGREPTCQWCRQRMKALNRAGLWEGGPPRVREARARARGRIADRSNMIRGLERAESAHHRYATGMNGAYMDAESKRMLAEVGVHPGERCGLRPCRECGREFWSADRRAVQYCGACRERILERDASSFEGEWA